MIYDIARNANQYKGISEHLDKALDFIANTNVSELECGHYLIDGENVFANVMEYTTKKTEEGLFESHKKYIDIHMMVIGEEKVIITDEAKVESCTEYSLEKDIQMHKGENYSDNLIKEGYFIICFPQDVHMPGMSIDTQKPVRKLVFKVRA